MTETGVPVSEPNEGQDLRDLSPHAGLELSPALRSHVLDPAVWQEHLETYAEPEQARPLASHEHERGRTTLAVSRRILVVDDERLSAVSWGKLLRTAGHEIRTAHDGFEALGVADAFRPDVVLLDIGLPKMNGYEVAQRIRQQPWGQGMVLIALTGWSQETDRHRSTAAGFDHHLVKPVDPSALLHLLALLP
jgi:CheY-like chemotaxis protein